MILPCIDNIHYHGLLNSATEDVSSVLMPQNIRTDARLFNDDVDIRFSRTLNSCKVPQIRYATVERLLERLTDLRFLSIDFLNTFLYTYRVFTSGSVVLEALIRVYRAPETCLFQHNRYGLHLFLFVCYS
ncbi:ras-specific guanine nucleotide-releasing factor 2-like [Branchiostoma floridae]|uniref:Ras-specific guanine nucleotide-releasing factor 2-like n=1 Tax=Branchiostoma floridae TaxID=7739 RepID=A0A9J7HWC2_BRAFL|nr:ras-specific guanine nucleotide-releasing factor 2-like [Branchiostoma floridae]